MPEAVDTDPVPDRPRRLKVVHPPGTAAPPRPGRWASPRWTAAGVTGLVVASALVRAEAQRAGYWIDEGISVGIASHPLGDIPGLLRQDGAPPLYYLLLHVWMRLFGEGEVGTHLLSLLAALATVPTAFWLGRSLFGRRVGWFAAVLAAGLPYLTFYGRETRMYTLVALLGLVAAGAFVHAFCLGRRRLLPVFAVALALMLYTHTWGLFFAAGAAAALVPCLAVRADRRRLLVDAGLAFGGAGLAFLPWVPTFLYQAGHTGAPWSRTPWIREAVAEVSAVLGDERVLLALLLVGTVSLAGLRWRPLGPDAAVVLVLLAMVVVPVTLAWLASQAEPAWATRYFAVIVGPLVLAAAVVLARGGRQGVVALVLVLLFWTHPLGRLTGNRGPEALTAKSNVREVTAAVTPFLRPGDLVVSSQPEQLPVLSYYLPTGLRYAEPRGLVSDPRVMDWRDALDGVKATTAAADLTPLVDALPRGGRLLFVAPVLSRTAKYPRWIALMRRRAREWYAGLRNDTRLQLMVGIYRPHTARLGGTPVYVRLYQRL